MVALGWCGASRLPSREAAAAAASRLPPRKAAAAAASSRDPPLLGPQGHVLVMGLGLDEAAESAIGGRRQRLPHDGAGRRGRRGSGQCRWSG